MYCGKFTLGYQESAWVKLLEIDENLVHLRPFILTNVKTLTRKKIQ